MFSNFQAVIKTQDERFKISEIIQSLEQFQIS
jgi:hypothetical protein